MSFDPLCKRANRFATLKFLPPLVLSGVLSIALLSGCEKDEDRTIAAGQACLDNARSADDADRCVSLVQGLETEPAYLIRCSANFIAQGFTGDRVASAFQELKDNPAAGENMTAKMMAYFVFSESGVLAAHTADVAVTNCERSGVKSMQRLATLAKLATFTARLAGGGGGSGALPPALDPNSDSFDPSQFQAQLPTIIGNATTADQEQIGTIAITANQLYCNEGSTFKEKDICKQLGDAIAAAAGDPATIGAQLLTLLQQGSQSP